MKQRNVRRREAVRYLSREYRAGRWAYFRNSLGAVCRQGGRTRAWHRRFGRPSYLDPSYCVSCTGPCRHED